MAQALDRAPSRALIAAALALLTLAIRAQTLGNPLIGFDEQFYLLVGDRMLHGALPYVDIFDRKPVGLFVIFAAIRALGGEGTLQSQLAAAIVVALTAGLLYRLARHIAPWPGALAAAAAYPLWLNLTAGEGTQAAVWFNLPVCAAALLIVRAIREPLQITRIGIAAMLLTGVAIQIKYTALFEGVFFGLALLWVAWHQRSRPVRLAALALVWMLCALAPTLLAAAAYARIGALDAFLFANFRSIGGRLPDPPDARALGLVLIAAIVAPLLLFARARALARSSPPARFALAWSIAALGALLGFGAFLAPDYAQPLIAPLAFATAPAFAARPRRAALLLAVALVAGQIVLYATQRAKGGRAQALALAAAAKPHNGCLYVYDGPPALYLLTHSQLPTRWPFPGHLNTANEGSIAALGIDPITEVRRILASHPETIVDTAPAYALGNPGTRALVQAELAHNYRSVLTLRTGRRTRFVYRVNDSLPVTPCAVARAEARTNTLE